MRTRLPVSPTFGKDRQDPAGGIERGLNAKEIDIFMAANLERAGDAAHWYYPMLMKGEWPVLLDIFGKGEGEERYLSVDEVRTLFVERSRPDRRALTERLVIYRDAFSLREARDHFARKRFAIT